jgi:hypothetical protein
LDALGGSSTGSDGTASERAQASTGLVWRVLLCREIEQIELGVFGLVPRHAHERIVPLRIDAR